MYSKIRCMNSKVLVTAILLLLVLGMSAARADKEEITLNQLSAPSGLSAFSILSPTPDTIRYDGDTALYYDPFPNTWTGVRFTPLHDFDLQAIYFGILNQFNNTTDGCSLYVVADDGAGRPDWPSGKLDSFWVASPVPDRVWIQVDLFSPIRFSVNEDFHIIYGPAPGGPYPGPGWWNLFDHDGTTTQRSYVSHDNRITWLTVTNSDAFIRAGGDYLSLPPDFNVLGISGGWAPWTRLLRLEIDSAGHGTYSIMYPEDRDTGIYTLLHTFSLDTTQLMGIYSSILEHSFFDLDTLHSGDKVDGSFCKLEITAGGTTHRVLTTNMEVPPFDSLVLDINAVTPGELDLIYNEIFLPGGLGPPGGGQSSTLKTVVWFAGCVIWVDIHIEFFGSCATQPLADAWETNIEDLWNNGGEHLLYDNNCPVIFDVITNVRAAGDPPTPNYHQINVPCDDSDDGDGHISSVDSPLPQPNGVSGSGNWDNKEPANTAAHEAGHLMGLDDKYQTNPDGTTQPNPGHENDIMGTLGGKAEQWAIDQIVNNAGVNCPWWCCRGACCLYDGTCLDSLTQTECEESPYYFQYQGDSTRCDQVECPTPCDPDPNDLGRRDALHIETFDGDHIYQADSGSFDSVRVAIYVTHDSNTFYWEEGGAWVQDSIAAFVIPLTFWHEPAGCADSVILPTWDYWNNSDIDPYLPWINRSMFRHVVDTHAGDTTFNRMLQMVENGKGPWTVYTDFESHSSDGDSGRCSFSCVPMSASCQSWWEGERVLLATLTFHVYMSGNCDTTEIGMDISFSPPEIRLSFTRYDLVVYFPCHFLPVRETIYVTPVVRGDANGDGLIDVADAVYLVNYLFIGGPAPDPLEAGDANCDGVVNIADAVYLINYLFLGGPPPGC